MNAMKELLEFVKEHKKMILGGLAGLILGILLLTIGFFATLLLAALVVLGAVLAGVPGSWEKLREGTVSLFRKIFKGKQ